MKSAMNRILIFSVMTIAMGCTRAADKRELQNATVVTSATVTDKKLAIKPLQITNAQASLKIPANQMPTLEYFRLIDSLQGLSQVASDAQIGSLARGLYDAFYANRGNYSQTTFHESILAHAIVGEGEPVIRQETALMVADLLQTKQKMSGLLNASAQSYAWPKKLQSLSEGIEVVDGYMAWLKGEIPGLKLSDTMNLSVTNGIEGEYKKLRPKLEDLSESMSRARTLSESLVVLNRAIKLLEIKLDPPQARRIRQANQLSQQLASWEDSQDVLTMLVMVWEMTPPKDRGGFRKESPELYDFFIEKDERELACLAKRHCKKIWRAGLLIAKGIVRLNLKREGLGNITRQIEVGARKAVKATALEEFTNYLPKLPASVNDGVAKSVDKYLKLISSIQRDVPGFARRNLNAWAKTSFTEPLRGLEVNEVNISLLGRGDIQVSPVTPAGGLMRTGSATLGASLALAHQFLPNEDGSRLRAAMAEPLMKLLAIGGFQISAGRQFPSFMLALDGAITDFFDLKKLMVGRTSFAVPDSFHATGNFLMDRPSAAKNVSVGAQAELLRGISRQIRFHRDWESNPYDVSLGAISAGELLTEQPQDMRDAVATSLLPKGIVFALALGNAGGILQNMILDLSPAFLMLEKDEVLWGNQYEEIKGSKVSTVAGMVEIVDGKRTGMVKTADIARFVLALDEFMAATEGMEQTNSPLLKTETKNGKSTLIADLIEVRKQLILLQMSLSNFLVQVAQQKGGSFHGTFQLGKTLERVPDTRLLETQALCIRALIASSKTLELPLLRTSALKGYYHLNRKFFDPATQFYASELTSEGKPGKAARLSEVALTLQAGEELSPYMHSDTRVQWEKLSAPWMRALQEL